LEQNKYHWENIYQNKNPEELSWTQAIPETSLKLIQSFHLSKEARIIDVGGGESRLVDCLLDEGFQNISVLDISETALNKARKRVGIRAGKVNWITADVTRYPFGEQFDLWHDRAVFHFMTTNEVRTAYCEQLKKAVRPGGSLIIGSFSENGPEKCSGLTVQRYNEHTLAQELSAGFELIQCSTENHITPFNTTQEFIFCSFKRTESHLVPQHGYSIFD
jgi:SAM-dependent methyltransferase